MSTTDFLIPTEERSIKEQPLWIFIPGPESNSLSQLLLLIDNVLGFDGKKNEKAAYNQIFRPKVHENYILKESDARAFLYLLNSTRVTISHLLFRVDIPSRPIIKDFTQFLPLQISDDCTPELQDAKEPDENNTVKTTTKQKKTR